MIEQHAYKALYHLRARDANKRWTEQLSLGNGKAMELNLIKHNAALKDRAGQLRNSEAPGRLSSTPTQRRGWSKEF